MGGSERVGTAVLIELLIIAAIVLSLCAVISNAACHEEEKQALMTFKQGLTDPSNRLATWTTGPDCCQWTGVVCGNKTGRIVELRLGNPHDSTEDLLFPGKVFERSRFGGEVNPSLLNLKHLRYLDLSGSDFEGEIPKFLGSLKNLRYLNLSASGFGGLIPPQLGNLTNLQDLDLHGLLPSLFSDNLQWLSNIRNLQHLDLSITGLSKASNWLQVTNELPSLVELRLSDCQLGLIPPLPNVNFSSLEILDLSGNGFSNPFVPSWIFHLSSLVYLDLSHNNFGGGIPDGLRNLSTSLTFLSLESNSFNSTIPDWLYSFSHLQYLSLADNSLQGTIPDAIVNLTSLESLDVASTQVEGPLPSSLAKLCSLRKLYLSGVTLKQDLSEVLQTLTGCISGGLEHLYLSRCQLFGHMSNQLSRFQNLTELYLTNNSISGPISESLTSLKSLTSLDLSQNLLNGTFPEWFGQLPELQLLWIDDNSLHGVVSEAHFTNVTKLRILVAARNHLVLKVSSHWVPPFQLGVIDLSSWKLGPRFPPWLRFQKDFVFLDISMGEINDTIPNWFWNLSTQFFNLNMSHNQIRGKVPEVFDISPPLGYPAVIDLNSNLFQGTLPCLSSNVRTLDLSNNSFSGSISHFLCYNMEEPKRLQNLHLANNQLSGQIPDCWMNWPNLLSVNLKNNNLSGNIPSSIGYLSFLKSLHVRRNKLSGVLPESMQNCTQLLALDLSGNSFTGNIPSWIGESLSNIIIIKFCSNNFQGQIPETICKLSYLTILDLGHNNLSGSIPKCFMNFSAMSIKRNSSVTVSRTTGQFRSSLEATWLMIKGLLREYSTTLPLLTSIDLCYNNLSGEIPEQITSLVGLISLNLSTNHLTGMIPATIGQMGSLESLDLSYNRLSGEIPQSMSHLTFLSVLDLAYNNLTGKIPSSTQLQSFNASSFTGNTLCGPPVTANCSTDRATSGGGDDSSGGDDGGDGPDGDGSEVDWLWFSVSLALGFVLGFWGFVGPLLFIESWRLAYYGMLDRLRQKINSV
ncbi:hypothetical protein SLEP1_g52565 [Rubroshorea leprosula]|uniref:Leucine-rich repeat-containing N-terminal plant-type domain-containing protein n=1 Tax=Rubroshorea leprosula TaxID=152421 RepID=A0AAV5M7L4_9ROSI|nr:hypothetical protein SLEP1_g52565 [Rubroshorea leprosula]